MWSDVVWMRGIQEVIQRSVIGFILHACLSPSYPLCCAILHHRILHILLLRLELILSYVVQYYITEYYIFYRFGLSPSYPLLCNSTSQNITYSIVSASVFYSLGCVLCYTSIFKSFAEVGQALSICPVLCLRNLNQ